MADRFVTADTLRQAFDGILKKLDEEGPISIPVDTDLYQVIPTDAWDKFDNPEIVVGSLYDDLDSLTKTLNNPENVLTYVDFDRTASLLRYLSEKLNPVT